MISLVDPSAFGMNAIGRMPALSVSVHASVWVAVSMTLMVLAANRSGDRVLAVGRHVDVVDPAFDR